MKKLSTLVYNLNLSPLLTFSESCKQFQGDSLSMEFTDDVCPEALKLEAIQALNQNRNQYPDLFGELPLREAISHNFFKYHHFRFDPTTEITVTSGATVGLFATIQSIVCPGDEIIIFEPFYTSYNPICAISHVKQHYVKLHAPHWNFNKNELRAAFNSHTKAIIINTPHNPTGKIFSPDEIDEIIQLCKEFDCYIIADIIYEHFIYDNLATIQHFSSRLMDIYDRVIVINSASKTFSVTGWRIGWIMANKEIMTHVRKINDYITMGSATPFQYAIAAGLNFSSDYFENLCLLYKDNREKLYKALIDTGFECLLPHGAYYMLAGYHHLKNIFGEINSDTDFSLKLFEKTGIITIPGSAFYREGNATTGYIRFCFCKKSDIINNVITRLERLI